ncbi:MAG TPA: TetR/AcrR family transcriptional regulator [Pseudonocardiaceae bacterium]|nr:TetR/AcrR family transcriptional regulator [Pseudonocardiaceae bacterium]
MTADPETRLRADARRNRDQILAAASALFVEQGPDVPMDEVARRAGIGVGTLYRRFPDRGALIRAVARDNLARVLADARAAVAEEPTAWLALVRMLRRSVPLQLTVYLAWLSPLASAIIQDDPMTYQVRDLLVEMLDELVRAAQAEGQLRPDIGPGDVKVLVSLLLRHLGGPPDERAAQLVTDRALAIMLDGLRAQPGSTLPGCPLSSDDVNWV